jgi:chitodextrinase
MQHRPFNILVALAAAALVTSCTLKNQEAPPLTGPSEFGTSITVAASPDVIFHDGASQSVVTVTARDANGQPLRNLSLRAAMGYGGTIMDFGSLSARNVVTGSDGRATVVYTAPQGPAGPATDTGATVDILMTPVGTDFANAVTRFVTIRLIPTGVVLPPDGLQPRFTFSPETPTDHQIVLFDASTSEAPPNNPIQRCEWNFGDGDTDKGWTVGHDFEGPGTFIVTLTVFDNFNRAASTSQSITVDPGIRPTPTFTFSPSTPLPNQQVNFNATASEAAPGRRIVSYEWDFGEGTAGATGSRASHTYRLIGTYVATLTVTDDAGRKSTISQSITVAFPEEDDGGFAGGGGGS